MTVPRCTLYQTQLSPLFAQYTYSHVTLMLVLIVLLLLFCLTKHKRLRQFGGRLQVKQLQKSLEPMRLILKEQPCLGGKTLNFADLAVAGHFAVCAPHHLNTAITIQQLMVFLSTNLYLTLLAPLHSKYQNWLWFTHPKTKEESKQGMMPFRRCMRSLGCTCRSLLRPESMSQDLTELLVRNEELWSNASVQQKVAKSSRCAGW